MTSDEDELDVEIATTTSEIAAQVINNLAVAEYDKVRRCCVC